MIIIIKSPLRILIGKQQAPERWQWWEHVHNNNL